MSKPLSHLYYNGGSNNYASDSEDTHTYHNYYVTHNNHGDYGSHQANQFASHTHTLLGVNNSYLLDDILDKPMTLQYYIMITVFFKLDCLD